MKKTTLSVVASLFLATNLYANETGVVVYSATKSEQSIKDITSNVEVITATELESKHITNIADAINLASGISFTRDGGLGQATKINIRGMHQTNTLVLIDGIRYNDPTNANGSSLEFLNLTNIEKIEIIKGAQSGIWGADASGGVINIITKKTISNGFKGNANFEYGSFNTKKYALSLSQYENDSYIKLDLNNIKTNGYSTQQPKNTNLNDYEDDGFESRTVNLLFGSKIDEKNKLDIIFRTIDSKGEYDAYNAPNNDTQKYDVSTKQTGINYNYNNEKYSLDMYINQSRFNRNYPNGYPTLYKGENVTYGFKSKIDYLTNDFLIVGAEENDAKDNVINKTHKNKALFATNTNKFSNTIITQSIRHDSNDNFNDKTTGKIGIKQIINQDISFNANYGTAYKAPTLTQLYQPTYGNENLKAESTKAFDIGFDFLGFKGTYFKNKIDNLISFHPTTYQNINIEGTSTIKGYELAYKKTISEILLKINYTYTEAKDKDNNTIGRIPKEVVKISFDYFGIKKFNFNLNGEYIGERWDRNYSLWNTPTPNGEQTGKYTLFNSVIDYKQTKNLSFYLKVDNLTDKKYQVVDGYSTSPRAYYVGLNAKF